MKLLLTTTCLLVAFVAAASADLTLNQKVEQEGLPQGDMTITLKIKDGKIRMDAGPKASTIIDTKTGEMQTLMHERKMVMTVPAATLKAMRQMAEKQAGGDSSTPPEPPKATGRTEKINGFVCEEYETTVDGSKVTMWLTQELPEAEKLLKQMELLSPKTTMYESMVDHPELSGFPMRSTMTSPDGKTTTITVVGLSEKPLPAADFSVPAGYKPMAMPSMPGR